MNSRSPAALFALSVLMLSACEAPVPRGLAPAPWFTIGKGPAGYTAIDTSRIEPDGSRRVIWLRTDYVVPDSAPRLPGAAVRVRETRHRVDCGARTVGDLESILRDSSQARVGGSAAVGPEARPFDAHPYGGKVFPTVCTAISMAAWHRRQGR